MAIAQTNHRRAKSRAIRRVVYFARATARDSCDIKSLAVERCPMTPRFDADGRFVRPPDYE